MSGYEARYEDSRGKELTTISNDGATLRMTLRGVEFAGISFDDFEPAKGTSPEALESFTLHPSHGELCSFRLELIIPLPVVRDGSEVEASLYAHLELGDPDDRNAIDREDLRLTLRIGDESYASEGTSGWFEDELLQVGDALPEGTFIKSCFTCAFSDYSPAGHGLFGDLVCFRECKEEYPGVETKFDLFKLLKRCNGSVQETHLCPEYARRPQGTGYRG